MQNASTKGIHTNREQLKRKGKEMKIAVRYREEILKDLSKFIHEQNDTDIVLVGDFNKSIISQRIEKFLVENSLFNIHEFINHEYKGKKRFHIRKRN